MKIKAAFFDRDGTLIEDVHYLDSIDKIKILPNIVGLLHYLQYNNYKLFIVTNQSGVARGYFDEKFVVESSSYLQDLFAKQNIFFEQTYFCPHLPTSFNIWGQLKYNKYLVNCACRKPQPGLILQAANDFNIDLSQSLMFGDKISDIEAGKAAGCKSFYIEHFLESQGLFPERVLNSLLENYENLGDMDYE